MTTIALVFSASLGCANEDNQEVERQLLRLESQLSEGVTMVDRALQDPTFLELSSGIQAVEETCQKLSLIEVNDSASAQQRLRSIVLVARAWDRVGDAFVHTRPDASYDTEALRLFEELLPNKGMPARVAAEAGYIRAHDFACQEGLVESTLMPELLEGIAKYSGVAPRRNAPCTD